jgi:nitroreductase
MPSLLPPSPEAFDHVQRLRVVRCYQPQPIPPAEVQAILEAGRWTGSARNRQAWAFVVIEERSTLDQLARAGGFGSPLLAAPLAIALVRLADGSDFDLGRAAQNMMQAAAARGVGSCPITMHQEEQAARILGLPDDTHCRWLIGFGYPDEEGEREQRLRARARGLRGRKPLSEVVHWERFGQQN